jgi:hypothetical protein
MAKNLLHCETGFGVYRSTQLGHIPFFLLLYLLVGPSIVHCQPKHIDNFRRYGKVVPGKQNKAKHRGEYTNPKIKAQEKNCIKLLGIRFPGILKH